MGAEYSRRHRPPPSVPSAIGAGKTKKIDFQFNALLTHSGNLVAACYIIFSKKSKHKI